MSKRGAGALVSKSDRWAFLAPYNLTGKPALLTEHGRVLWVESAYQAREWAACFTAQLNGAAIVPVRYEPTSNDKWLPERLNELAAGAPTPKEDLLKTMCQGGGVQAGTGPRPNSRIVVARR
jgi:hypothetical protein